MTGGDSFGPPEEGAEDKLAFRLAAQENPLEARILHMLAGKPRRFRDFRAVLVVRGKSDTPVARALRKLALDGLIDQGLTSDPTDKEFRYSLTGLGLHVLFRSHEFKDAATVIQELKKSHVLSA